MASQIEIDGQDDGEEDDGAQDEDQDAVLNDPVHRRREKQRNIFEFSFSWNFISAMDLKMAWIHDIHSTSGLVRLSSLQFSF